MKVLQVFLALMMAVSIAHAMPGLLIPLYTYPTDNTWTTVKNAAIANPSIPIIAVVNPDSGPGTALDSNYVNGINELVNAGVKCIGYVSTNYTFHPTTTVTGNMDSYKSWYPNISGFFLDEMINTGSHESYYATLTSHAISIGMPYTVGNAGTSTSRAYFNTVNNTVIYEHHPLPQPGFLDLGFPSEGCSLIAYDVPASALNQTYIDAIVQHTSLIYITDDKGANPYDTLPTYFNQLVNYLLATVPPSSPEAPSTPASPLSTPLSNPDSAPNVPSSIPTPAAVPSGAILLSSSLTFSIAALFLSLV